MLLAKNCHPRHNILTSKTLRLGSLYEYRSTYEKQIVDEHEGLFYFSLQFKNIIEIKKKWFNTLFGSLMMFDLPNGEENYNPPGRSKATFKNVYVKKVHKETLEMQAEELRLTREIPNGFIFCMSEVPDTEAAHGLFPDYKDRWFLNQDNIYEFVHRISKSLHKKIAQSRLEGDHIIPSNIPISQVEIYCQHALVIYTPKEITISKESDISIDHFMKIISNLEFYKPTSYSHEREYRFSFQLIINGLIIPPLKNSIILDAEEVVDMVFK